MSEYFNFKKDIKAIDIWGGQCISRPYSGVDLNIVLFDLKPGFEFNDNNPKQTSRIEYDNILYLERPGCNLCMGNQEKAEKGDTVMATSTRLFKGRVVEDSKEKKGASLLASTPVVVLSAILGRTPTIEEYKSAVENITLTKFAPPVDQMKTTDSIHF